jgi:hypothetical protein
MNLRIAVLTIATLGMTASNAVAGVILTAKGGQRKGQEESTLYFEGNKMRIEGTGSDQESILIYDGDTQRMIAIEPKKKTFTEMTPESLKAATSDAQKKMQESMSKMSPEQRKQMDAAMAQMDPEQRKRMQEMMSGKMPSQDPKSDAEPPAKWERTGTTQTVAGYACEGFKQVKKGKVKATGCYIPWNAGALTKADIAPLTKMQEFMAQAGWTGMTRHGVLEELRNAPGFPGIWENVGDDGKPYDNQTLTSIKRGSVSADKFRPPAGFSKVDMSQLTH